jgi:hypothetical protein
VGVNVVIFSRHDFNDRFASISRRLCELRSKKVVLDVEIEAN